MEILEGEPGSRLRLLNASAPLIPAASGLYLVAAKEGSLGIRKTGFFLLLRVLVSYEGEFDRSLCAVRVALRALCLVVTATGEGRAIVSPTCQSPMRSLLRKRKKCGPRAHLL